MLARNRVTLPGAALTAGVLATLGLLASALAAPVPAGAERVSGTVRWDLAAGQPRLTTRTRRVRIAVSYGACMGTPGKPRVKRTGRSVVITVPLPPSKPLPPGVHCPAIGYTKTVAVRLRRPLGCRALRDGSKAPPRFVARPRR